MRTFDEWQEADMEDEARAEHDAGTCRFDTCALCWKEHEALMSFLEDEEEPMTAKPLHLDPEVARMFSGESEEETARAAEVKAVYLARKEIEGKVRKRADKAVRLTCKAYPQPDAYHVTGGDDPAGHTVDLRAAWGVQCTCGSHMMDYALCKHLICVYMVRGAFLADTWEGGAYRPGLVARAVQVDLENAAYRAAKREQERTQ